MDDIVDVNPNLMEEVEEAENFGKPMKTPEEAVRDFVDEKQNKVIEKAGELKDSISDKASRAKESISETFHDTRETISDRTERARDEISEKAGRAKESMSEKSSSVGSWLHGVAQSIGLEKKPMDTASDQMKRIESEAAKPAGSEYLPPPVYYNNDSPKASSSTNDERFETKEQSKNVNPSLIHSFFGGGPHHKQNDHPGTLHGLPFADTSSDHKHDVHETVGNESGLVGSHPVETHTHKGFLSGIFGGSSNDTMSSDTAALQKDAKKYDEFVKDSAKEREGRQEGNQNKVKPEQVVD